MTTTLQSQTTLQKIKTTRINLTHKLLLGVFFFLLLWGGIKGWLIIQAAQSLQNRQIETEELLVNGFSNIDPDAAESLILGIRHDVLTLKKETAIFIPLTPYLDWVPKVGPTLASAPQLMEMADAGTETAVYALNGFKPLLKELDSQAPNFEPIPSALQAIDAAKPELAAMRLTLNRVAIARNEIENLNELPWRIRTLMEQLDQWLPLAQESLLIAPYLPQILGIDGPHNYLILAQNSDELRPTGGFISGAGNITIDNGRIVNLSFQDSILVDDWKTKPYNFPPQPLYEFMLLELFLFRDANFWPDFPTSAEKAMELYSYGLDVPLPDGVIAIDQQFLKLLVEALGNISIPESNLIVNQSNISESLQAAWAIQDGQEINDWALNRKAFMGVFAAAIQEKILSDMASIDMVALARNMSQAVEKKNLQIYLRDPAVAAILHQLHWDGRLPSNTTHDFLLTVDTNMGYNKVNGVISQNLIYKVRFQDNGPGQADLEINYQHSGEAINEPCTPGPIRYSAETVTSYQNLVNDCYWNFLRIYVPKGSQLLESTFQSIPNENMMNGQNWNMPTQTLNDIDGFTTYSNFLMVQRGQSLNNKITYQLPNNIIKSVNGYKQYILDIFKQAGTSSKAIEIEITMPEGAIFDEISPSPTNIDGTTLLFDFNLIKDTVIIINYH